MNVERERRINDLVLDRARLVNAYEECGPLYKCDPAKNTECSKTSCQNPCRMTKNKAFSTDGVPLTLEEIEEIEKDKDVTELVDTGMPKRWQCPHCGRENVTGIYAEEILLENFKYLEQCRRCGYLHLWLLTLTEEFKRKVIENLLKGGKE